MVLLDLFRKPASTATNEGEVNYDPNLLIDKDVAAEQCLSCRVFGSTVFVSLGGYIYYSGMQSLRQRKREILLSKARYKYGSRQLGILSLSGTLVGLGIYRMFN